MQLASLVERTARYQPNKMATVFGARKQTWAQLVERSSRFASAIRNLGLAPGDRLAILALNSDRYLEVQIAALWAEAVLVPLNTMWSIDELLFAINDTTPQLLLVDDTFLEHGKLMLSSTEQVHNIINIGDTPDQPGMLDYNMMIEEAASFPAPSGSPDGSDLAGIYYTGGTTGFPKGVMLSHSSVMHSGLYASVEMGYSRDEIFLHVAPMFHLGDGSQTVANTLFGITHCFVPTFEAESTLQKIQACKITSLVLLPSMLQNLFDHPRFDDFDLSSLGRIIYGDSPISPTLRERVMRALPSIDLFQAYGLTEMGPLVALLRPEDMNPELTLLQQNNLLGRPMVGVEVRIVDEQFNQLAPGEIGRIIATGKNAMLGYWNRTAETAEALVDGWVVTGDLGYIDNKGFLYLADREKDTIVVDGEQVFSVEVENVLVTHPAVRSAAVIGIPRVDSGQSVHAVIIAKSDKRPTEDELVEHCKISLASYKCPTSISFRQEPMPLSAVGKVLKNELRKFWLEGS
jgi:long-chain acyl-CoA synthetase